MSRHEVEIPEALVGERVDRIVALVADCPRRLAADAVAAGRVSLDGRVVTKASERVEEGAHLIAEVEDEPDGPEADDSVDVPIVHADDAVLVVDKPAGLVVHPGAGAREGTMVHGLLARFPELADVGEPERPGVVHRLDKGTSGLLVVARTEDALDELSAQLAAREVSRVYRAVCRGDVDGADGVVDAPLGRDPRDPTRRAVVADGRPARTHYEVLRRGTTDDGQAYTELSCRLETGRTHQIRVHLAAIDHPIAGDDRYGGRRGELGLDRPWLHAERLGFHHPVSGDWLEFESPIPADLTAALQQF